MKKEVLAKCSGRHVRPEECDRACKRVRTAGFCTHAAFYLTPKDGGESTPLCSHVCECAGPDNPDWKDDWGDGCDWYAHSEMRPCSKQDWGTITYLVEKHHRYVYITTPKDLGTNCPVSCNPGCVQSFLCGDGTVWRNGKCQPGDGCGAGKVLVDGVDTVKGDKP